jgi:hypothetical protein
MPGRAHYTCMETLWSVATARGNCILVFGTSRVREMGCSEVITPAWNPAIARGALLRQGQDEYACSPMHTEGILCTHSMQQALHDHSNLLVPLSAHPMGYRLQ